MSKRVGSLVGIVVTRHFSFDPLHHAANGAALARRLKNTLAARERRTDCRFSRCVDPRPTDRPAALGALVSRSAKSGVYPFLNDRALELTPSIWKMRPSGGGGCVNRLLFKVEVASSGVKFAKKADEILQRSAKPVYRPRCNDIDLATHDRFQKPIELRSFVAAFGAADAFVGEFIGSTEVRIRPQVTRDNTATLRCGDRGIRVSRKVS
jgi:hypothetical protein